MDQTNEVVKTNEIILAIYQVLSKDQQRRALEILEEKIEKEKQQYRNQEKMRKIKEKKTIISFIEWLRVKACHRKMKYNRKKENGKWIKRFMRY